VARSANYSRYTKGFQAALPTIAGRVSFFLSFAVRFVYYTIMPVKRLYIFNVIYYWRRR